MSEPVDVVVIGMGVGGEELAGQLAEAGLKVVGIEKELVGGECPYWACVPTKMMVRAANLLAEAQRIPGMAGQASVTADWAPVALRIRKEATDYWDDRVAVERFEKKGGQFVRGTARVVAPHAVEVNSTTYEAARGVVIATGSSPSIPRIPGLETVEYWTNRQAVKVEHLPASLLVLGGGPVGLELAQAFARFGVKVTVIEAAPGLLPLEEPEAGQTIATVFRREAIEVLVGAKVISVEARGSLICARTESGHEVQGERLLVATGRSANVKGVGLEAIGIDTGVKALQVDDHLRVKDGVWAVGDVTGKGLFTHVALYQAGIATADILGKSLPAADYESMPRVTFTDPEVGSSGLTEAAARKRGVKVRTGTSKTSSSARGWIHGPGNDGFIKLIEETDRGVLVGATAVGPIGGDLLSMLELAIAMKVPVERLRRLIYAYPAFYGGIQDALREL